VPSSANKADPGEKNGRGVANELFPLESDFVEMGRKTSGFETGRAKERCLEVTKPETSFFLWHNVGKSLVFVPWRGRWTAVSLPCSRGASDATG
jgi:hypothetical protein